MDADPISRAVQGFEVAITAVSQAIDSMPDGLSKDNARAALEQAKRELQIAKVQSARPLGYLICHNHFPPGVMLSEDDAHWKCPICDNERYTGPGTPKVSVHRYRSRP